MTSHKTGSTGTPRATAPARAHVRPPAGLRGPRPAVCALETGVKRVLSGRLAPV